MLLEQPSFAYVLDLNLFPYSSASVDFRFNYNALATLRPLDNCVYNLRSLDLSYNVLSRIEPNALIYMKRLEKLSLAHNQLSSVQRDHMAYLYSLNALNLSHNRIASIEAHSFLHLDKLKSLDLSYNVVLAFTSEQLTGLIDLADLWLAGSTSVQLGKESLTPLESVANFYVDALTITLNECLFAHGLKRPVKRSIKGKFKFYKSVNLIAQDKVGLSCSKFCLSGIR